MMQIGRMILNPLFASKFTVTRSNGKFALGGWQEGVPEVISMVGVVLPSTAKEHELLPEAERVKEAFTFYSIKPIYMSRNAAGGSGTSDSIDYFGVVYSIHWIKDYSKFGYYKAIGVRTAGD